MAAIIPQGGFKGDTPHPVTGDPDNARGEFTRGWVRKLLGLQPTDEVICTPVTRDPETNAPAGFVFYQKPAAAHGGGKLPNLRASCLCGILLYGPAVHVTASDRIEWRPGV